MLFYQTHIEEALKEAQTDLEALRKEVSERTDRANALKLKMLVQEKQHAHTKKKLNELQEENVRLESVTHINLEKILYGVLIVQYGMCLISQE